MAHGPIPFRLWCELERWRCARAGHEARIVTGPDKRIDCSEIAIPEGLPDEDLRELLIQRINEIDQTKREIKTQVHEANVRAQAEGRPRDRAWQVRAQDKDKHLTRVREEIRKVPERSTRG